MFCIDVVQTLGDEQDDGEDVSLLATELREFNRGVVAAVATRRLRRVSRQMQLDLPLPRYLWDIAKSTTKAERLSCAAALIVLVVCILLIVYFTVIAKRTVDSVVDIAPHEWYITREMWLAPEFFNDGDRTQKFDPLRLVIIAHTVSPECTLFVNCAAELRNMQGYFRKNYNYDLPYNFLIGNEGRVYEGRGWNVVGAHTRSYNRCSLGIGFIGDYREGLPQYSKVNEKQLERAKMLLDLGVRVGYLHPNYHVLGAKDLQSSESPGTNLYRAIQNWTHYDHYNHYQNKSCEEIYEYFQNKTSTVGSTAIKNNTVNNEQG
nr:peptidoglycan-recognition protein 1 isoform X2 [Helicoverpa armigera]